MDNVTHTLIGAALGRSAGARSRDPRLKNGILWASILGNNLPDLDFLQVMSLGGGKLAYLLQHRGHTHTLWFILPGAIFASWIAGRITGISIKQSQKLLPVSMISVFLHIAADLLNNYGVHPFTPWKGDWIYGDVLYILEPLIWLAALPMVFFTSLSKSARAFSTLLYVLLLTLIWGGPFVSIPTAAGLSLWGGVFFWINRRHPGPRAAWIGISITLAIFSLGSTLARHHVRQQIEARAPNEKIQDIALTPGPGNPVCWTAIAISTGPGDEYKMREALVDLLPLWGHCTHPARGRRSSPLSRTAPMLPVSFELPAGLSGWAVEWQAEFQSSLKDGSRIRKAHCSFDQLLLFARAPFWDGTIAGDLRYDFESGSGFSEIQIERENHRCLSNPPQWNPPRRFE